MKEAIVLLNMGGPNSLDEVEVFLTNMFNDPNILTMKSTLLRRFVATMITFFRTEKSQEIYRQLGGKSPLVGHTQKLVDALQARLEGVVIDFAMRYTPPFADASVARLKAAGVERVYLIPLYPQYSTTTTKSSLEDYEAAMRRGGFDATTVEIKHFFENERYNACICARLAEAMEGEVYGDFDLIFSAHGLPQKIVDAGDPYALHVNRHAALITRQLEALGMRFAAVHVAYQSKVGPMKWLEPSLETKLKTISNRKVLICPIAFTIDNSETDFELHVEYAEVAHELGYESYRVSRCPNDHPLFVESLLELYEKMRP
ncbi:MAG: ferrochelatase [Campylobacterales bacterium]|nr:ferrochelatase [Campylobacterales bacterium]